jgi:hypothetical protein
VVGVYKVAGVGELEVDRYAVFELNEDGSLAGEVDGEVLVLRASDPMAVELLDSLALRRIGSDPESARTIAETAQRWRSALPV